MTVKPDPAFVDFFHNEWKDRHEAVQVPGMPFASWDRKAAWLLWVAEGRALPATDMPEPTATTSDAGSLFD